MATNTNDLPWNPPSTETESINYLPKLVKKRKENLSSKLSLKFEIDGLLAQRHTPSAYGQINNIWLA